MECQGVNLRSLELFAKLKMSFWITFEIFLLFSVYSKFLPLSVISAQKLSDIQVGLLTYVTNVNASGCIAVTI